jgi:hypothetical protein
MSGYVFVFAAGQVIFDLFIVGAVFQLNRGVRNLTGAVGAFADAAERRLYAHNQLGHPIDHEHGSHEELRKHWKEAAGFLLERIDNAKLNEREQMTLRIREHESERHSDRLPPDSLQLWTKQLASRVVQLEARVSNHIHGRDHAGPDSE